MITIDKIRIRLQESIKQSGYTQTELAKLLGVSQPSIAYYLNGGKMPALDTLANLCKIIDVSPSYILCFEN